ncbi:LysR family transcriptional regulator [Pseudogemmobacter sonorensis]|uniref:LysR family transcriptional regulator n=1 Tax=Pseudogemmobacter sonorensis TaxID=2989681 RepID=UPI00368A4AA0
MKRVFLSRFSIYLDEIARQGSVRKAADSLNVSASAIDKQLIRAEEALGVSLFERLPRGMRLTSAGEVLIHRLRGWQKDLLTIRREIEELQGLSRGEVRVVAPQEIATGLLPEALAAFARAHPRIAMLATLAEPERIRQMVLDGQADFGLTFSPQPLPGVSVSRDMGFEPRAVLPATDVEARHRSMALDRFFARPVILPDSSTHLRDVMDIAAARARIRSAPVLTTNSLELMRAMVRAGAGYGMTATRPDAPLGPVEGVVLLPFPRGAMPGMVLSLIAPMERSLPVAAILAKRCFETIFDAAGASAGGAPGSAAG